MKFISGLALGIMLTVGGLDDNGTAGARDASEARPRD